MAKDNSKEVVKIQKGIFCYLNNRGLSIQQMRWAIKQFYKENDPQSDTMNVDFGDKQQYICENFQAFKKYVKRTFVIQEGYSKTYEESWEEKNLDGSFAYNGVTEDF